MKAIANNFIFLLRREMWENRSSVIMVPIAIAALIFSLNLVAYFFGAGDFGQIIDHTAAVQEEFEGPGREGLFGMQHSPGAPGGPADFSRISWVMASGFIMLIAYVVAVFYASNSLLADRKDRSILFWKSLPIRETNQVLSKLFFAGVVIPCVAVVVSIILMFLSSLVYATAISESDHYTWLSAWSETKFLEVSYYYMVLVPIFVALGIPGLTWIMLMSAYAKKSPIILASVIPFALVCSEALIFRTDYIATFILEVFGYYYIDNIPSSEGAEGWSGLMEMYSLDLFIPTIAQATKMLVLMSVCIPSAIWLRNNRYEI